MDLAAKSLRTKIVIPLRSNSLRCSLKCLSDIQWNLVKRTNPGSCPGTFVFLECPHTIHIIRENIKYRNHHGEEKDRPYASVSQIRIVNPRLHNFAGRIPGSGLPEKSGRGCVAKFFLTLTLFSTTFPVLPHQKLDTQLMTIMACSVALNISYVGLLLMVLSIMMKR